VGGSVGEAIGSRRKGDEDRSGEGVETNEGRSGIGTRRKGEDDRSGRGDVRKGDEGGEQIGSRTILTSRNSKWKHAEGTSRHVTKQITKQ
jgi:hypothetical protein